MTMYVPKKVHVIWDLLWGGDTEYADYPHKCKICGGDMRIVEDYEPIICPHCKKEMKRSMTGGFWD